MRLELKVTHTPNSKSKRPWERWTWSGSKTGSVLLLAQGRIKVLNLQEKGSSVKKKVTKLSSIQNSAIATGTTRDGQYLVGYLESGDIFVWNKDQDTLKTVKGHPSINAPTQQGSEKRTESIQLFASNNLHNILLVKGHRSVYLWEIDQPESALRLREVELKGTWSLIGGDKTPLPGADSSEAVSDAVFMNDRVLGRSCVWSVVFYQGDDIQISTVLVRWFEPWHHGGMQRHPAFSVRWLSSKHSVRSLSPSSWPVNHHGALAASYNNSGHVLAVALNQRSPHETKMVFVSPLTAAATVVDMKSCGCKTMHPHADHIKTYWISDMTWTHNDLFLVCITKRGALAILPRLGEPILLQSEGCSVEHPPAYFLPLLNLVTVMKPSTLSGDRPPSPTSSLTSESDEGRQRFTVSCHSSHPMILCSDGYLGLVMELPADLTCPSILSDYLSEGATALHLMYSARDLGPVGLGSLRREATSPNLQSAQQRTFSNMIDMLATADSMGLESTRSSDLGYNGPFGNMTSGKLVFDDSAMMASTQSLGFLPMGNHSIESLIQWTQMAALSAWGLGVSHAGPWNSRLEYLMQYTTRVFMALFWILLRNDEEVKLPKQRRKSISGPEDDAIDLKLSKVLSLYKAILASSLWDSLNSHSMYSYLLLTRSLVKKLLKGQVCDQISMTRCCIAVLHSSEQVLSRVYIRRPVSEPSYLPQLSFHPSDTVEHALAGQRMHNLAIMSSSSTKRPRQATQSERSRSRTGSSAGNRRGKKRETRSETSSLPTPKKDLALTQGQREPLSQGGAVGRRMIPTWKRLYRHINKLLGHSTRAKGVSHFSREQRELIQLLCYVQRKLHLHGYSVPLHLHSKWTQLSNTAYLKGCECYIKNLPAKAVRLWHLAIADPQPHRSRKKGISQQASVEASTSSTRTSISSSRRLPEDTKRRDENTSLRDGEVEEASLRDQIVEASLLGILYTHLLEGDLQRALELADSLITCQNVGSVTAPEKRGRRLPDLPRKDMQKLPPASPTSTPIYVPYLANSCQQRAVQSLARFMALYFTNRPLYVFPPCLATPLPPLHVQSKMGADERQIQITHEVITSNVRLQDLSDKWTVNMTLNLLLVSGLVPEAVWLAHELGDWKSSFALSAVYSSEIQNRLRTKDSSTLDESLVLPPNLSPTNLLREGLNSVLQTPILDPQSSPAPGKKVQRAGSFSGSQRRGSCGSLLDSPAMPIRKSSSVCSLVEEDKLAQVMLSQTLTDILTAATLSRQDPTHWLLESMMEECLILAKGFTSLVPEEFYLPAPPYYCPQPEYIPNDSDPPEVLEEDDHRREINDLVQLILLVLNASHCSLPCARWYVEQLREVQEKEKTWKAKESSVEMPAQLQAHTSYPVDILSGMDDPNNNLDSNGKGSVLKCFRDLCCLLWMLYVRDKLSLAVRKYQTSKERSTHVQQTTDSKESEKTKKLLKPVLDWAECLYPFSRFLQLENEVNDILLTAIAELPLTKETVSILGRHFYDIRDLPPFLEDKFGRLREKLRRKKVPADQRQKKKKEGREVPDGETTPVVLETLMTYYKRQSKKRVLERNNRKASFRSLDDSVFEADGSKEQRSRVASKEEDDSVFDSTAGSSATPLKENGNRLNSEEARLFQVGSREFEGSSAYLHFLETFFLVTFGRQVQEDAFMSQTELPLIRSFHTQVLDSEIKKNAGRAQQKPSLPVIKPSDLQFGQGLDVAIDQDETKSVPSKIRGPGLFKKLFGGPLEREEVMEIPRIPLKCSNSQTSLPGSGGDSPRRQRERRASKSRNTMQLKRMKEDTCFTGITVADGFKPIRMNFGKDFQQLGKLVDWLSKWSGRQPSKGFQKVDNPAEESKAVIQVKLPQQLILVSVWLLQQVYAPDTLQVEEKHVHASPKHEVSHDKVHFTFVGKHTAKKHSALSGRHRHSGRRKRVLSVSRHDKTKPSGREKVSVEDDHLPGEDVPPVDLTRPISVGNIPAIVIEKSGSSDNLVDSGTAIATANANDNHPLLERPLNEVGSESMEEVRRTSGNWLVTEAKEAGKKRRKLPKVSEEKRRNSPNISQLLREKMPISVVNRSKSRVKSIDVEREKASKKLTLKKRSSSDPRRMDNVTEYEMTDFGYERNKTAHIPNASDDVPQTPTHQAALGYVDTEYAISKPQVDARSNLHRISDDTLHSSPRLDLAGNHCITTDSVDAVNVRRPSVEIIRRSSSGGGILSSEGHFYESSSSTSSPDVSSLEDSDDDDGIHGLHPGMRTDEVVESVMKSAMAEDEEDRNLLSDVDKTSQASRVVDGKEKNGDVKKLVRSEVKRIMEAQHQSMMNMLDTAGTLILNNLEQTANGQQHHNTNGSLSSSELQSHRNKVDQVPQGDSEPETIAGPSTVMEAQRGHGVEGDSLKSKHTRTHDSEVQVEMGADAAPHESQSNGVPPLKLEDLATSRAPGYHHERGQQSARHIPGMIRGFPLLTVPKDSGRGGKKDLGMFGGSEYDLIPTRERDSARTALPGKKDIVLLRALPERTGASFSSRRGPVEPPLYKQSFTYDVRTPRGPPNYATSGTQPQEIGGMPLLRILPEKDFSLPIPHPSNVPYSQMTQPKMVHHFGQNHTPPYPVGQYGPPWHTPRDAWGNPPVGGTHQAYPPQGKIDIPLLRIEHSVPFPVAPQPMHQVPVNSQVQSEYHPRTERTSINLPLLRVKDSTPQPPLQPNLHRPLQPKLPLVSPEEILAYQQEKRRKELEKEQEFRKQNGGPMQLLHLEPEPTVGVLATTSRQRRRERLESKENDPRTEFAQGPKGAKIRKSSAQTKGPNQRKGRTLSKADDLIVEEAFSSEEEELKEKERPRVPPKGRVVMVMPKDDQTASSRQRAGDDEDDGMQLESVNKMESDLPQGTKRPSPTTHDVETQVSALGAGYALKPGSHDEALKDPDARPLLPTSAQIHYETVMKLQQPPPVVKTREAETQMKDVREAGTSMEGREGLDIIQERLARGRTGISSEEAKPTLDEVEEQYTRAATGLNKAGNIIAPDIFFGLRFRSGEEQASSTAGPDAGQPGSSGRDFIHVADINADDVFRDIPQHADSKDYRGRRRRGEDDFQHPERDGSSRRSSGEKDAKRRREDSYQEEEEEEDQATIAELHYKSLFHRDAAPTDGLALLEDDEEVDGAERRKRIGDEVTRKLLEAKLDKAERGMKLASEISSSRNQSKGRIQHQLAQMNERLGAIDEVSQSMQRDFSNTRLLLHTVENLSEAMAQRPGDARPRPDYSLKDYKEPRTTESPKTSSHSSDHRHGDEATVQEEDEGRKDNKPDDAITEERKDDFQKEDREEEGEIDREDGDNAERTMMTEGNLTLGISGISGVSDIIAEVIAGDDVDADEFGLTEQQKRAAKRRVQTKRDSFNEEDLTDIPLTSLTDRQLRQIFSPRSAFSPEEKTKPWPFAAKPEGRSAEERQKIKEWMERKRAQQIDEYKKKRGEKIEREHKPFRPKGDSLKQIPTSTREIKRAEEEKKTKKQAKTQDHFEDRLAQAKDLMAEIFEDKPNIPQRPLIEQRKHHSDKLRKQATSSMRGTATPTTRNTPQPSARTAATPQASLRKAATPQPRRDTDSRMTATRVLGDRSNVVKNDGSGQQSRRPLPKGTYMFIDSETYRGPVMEEKRRMDDHGHHQDRSGIVDKQQHHPAYRTSTDRRPPQRSLQASMERSVQFVDPRRSSEEDLQLVLAEMSDLVTPRSEEDDQEIASSHLESATMTYHKPKPFTDVVRVQRPEVTRKNEGTPRKPKTYTDMLQEMKAEVSSSRAPSSVKSKQRLYGSTRLPGWNKNRKQYTKTPKTYTERLAEMKGAQGRGGQKTRLVQRPRPRPRPSQQERLGTATMTIGPSRRQQVERRGITPEPGPRSSTPYTAMLAELSNSGTHRGREPVVSPRLNPGMRAKPRAHEPVPYVDRLKQNAAEATASTPPKKYRTVYGTRPVPTGTYYTHKAPPLRTPSPRHQPYEMGTRQPGRAEDDTSDVSALSPWSVSDDVRRLLEEDDDLDEGLPTIREPQYEISDFDDQEYGDYAASVDIHELQEIASVGSGSIMSNIDWDAIDKMIETVE